MVSDAASVCYALLFIAILAVFGWLMITRRLTATLALPLAAVSIAVIALVPVAAGQGFSTALGTLFADVLEPGVTRLSTAIMAVILGSVLAALMNLTGAAERIVRYAAEYAGEDRFRLGVLLLVVISVLFTTLGGLGAVILVASITLPLMFSLGFQPRVAGGLFLFGLSLGGCLNPMNWAMYVDILKLEVNAIVPYAVALACCFFVVACLFLLTNLGTSRGFVGQTLPVAATLAVLAVLGWLVIRLPALWQGCKVAAWWLLAIVLTALWLAAVVRLVLVMADRGTGDGLGWLEQPGNWLAGASVLVPLLMLLLSSLGANLRPENPGFSVGILTALALGIAFCALASYTRQGTAANRVMRALFEGVTQGGPAVVLMIGIGLLLKATTLPVVVGSFQPLLERLPIGNPVGYVAVFLVLSPLALYRGPFNLWGMGSGVISIINGIGILGSGLVMSAFFSVGMLQGVCDPTNTHNVWIANFCKVPVAELTRVTIPWVLAIVLLGLITGVTMFSTGFGI